MDFSEAPVKDESKSQQRLLMPRWGGWALLYQIFKMLCLWKKAALWKKQSLSFSRSAEG